LLFKSIDVENGCSNCPVIVGRNVDEFARLLRWKKSHGSAHSCEKVDIAAIVQLESVIPHSGLIMSRYILFEDMENS